MKFLFIWIIAVSSLFGVSYAAPENTQQLPRFVSLASHRVYVRVGPGKTFAVAWEVRREGMPVEIILESDGWRKIRDFEGTEGWIHKSMLSNARRIIFLKGVHALVNAPQDQAKVIAHVEEGVIGNLVNFNQEWAEVKLQTIKGWVRRESIWGLYPHEVKSPSKCWIPFLCRQDDTK